MLQISLYFFRDIFFFRPGIPNIAENVIFHLFLFCFVAFQLFCFRLFLFSCFFSSDEHKVKKLSPKVPKN